MLLPSLFSIPMHVHDDILLWHRVDSSWVPCYNLPIHDQFLPSWQSKQHDSNNKLDPLWIQVLWCIMQLHDPNICLWIQCCPLTLVHWLLQHVAIWHCLCSSISIIGISSLLVLPVHSNWLWHSVAYLHIQQVMVLLSCQLYHVVSRFCWWSI